MPGSALGALKEVARERMVQQTAESPAEPRLDDNFASQASSGEAHETVFTQVPQAALANTNPRVSRADRMAESDACTMSWLRPTPQGRSPSMFSCT